MLQFFLQSPCNSDSNAYNIICTVFTEYTTAFRQSIARCSDVVNKQDIFPFYVFCILGHINAFYIFHSFGKIKVMLIFILTYFYKQRHDGFIKAFTNKYDETKDPETGLSMCEGIVESLVYQNVHIRIPDPRDPDEQYWYWDAWGNEEETRYAARS